MRTVGPQARVAGHLPNDDRLESSLSILDTPDKSSLCSASTTPRHRTVRDPEGVHRAVVRRRWPRWWDLLGDGREHPQVCDERTDILFVPVRRVVPDHALPMERATVSTDAASNGSGDLFVGPRADPCSHIAGDVATP